MEIIDIVDLNNDPVGQATREEIYQYLHPHRIVHVLIMNAEGKIALQLNAEHKKFYPGYWGTSVGGHVQSGESYEEAARREAEEEFGLTDIELQTLGELVFVTPKGQTKFIKVFSTTCEKPLSFDPSETEKIEYFAIDDIRKMRRNGERFAPELLRIIDEYIAR